MSSIMTIYKDKGRAVGFIARDRTSEAASRMKNFAKKVDAKDSRASEVQMRVSGLPLVPSTVRVVWG